MDPDLDAAPAPPRPLGLLLVAGAYLALGAHALLFGLLFLAGPQEGVPLEALGRVEAGIVRAYALGLLGISATFFANGVALLRGKPWARWLTLGIAPLHMVGPPFLLGGVLFAALVNAYLHGSERVRAYLLRPRRGAAPLAT